MKVPVLVLVGLPGSGKSTVANLVLKEGGLYRTIISSDAIRKELFGSESIQCNNEQVFKIYYDRFVENLVRGDGVILDATNITIKARKHVFEAIKKAQKLVKDLSVFTTALVINTPVERVVKQDRDRERTVGLSPIYKYLYSYQHPQKYEGFNEVRVFYDTFKYDKALNTALKLIMANFDQNNPHHLYPLLTHCENVASNYDENDLVMYQAATFHDVGKLFTQTTDENGISHYKGHDSVGAYYLVSHPELLEHYTPDELNEILFFVNFHMRAHSDFKGEKAARKYKELFNNVRFTALMQFGEYDRIASGTYSQNNK